MRFLYCCRSASDVGSPSMTIEPAAPRLGRPSLPTGTLTRCLNFGSRYRSKRSGGSMMCMSESTKRSPSLIGRLLRVSRVSDAGELGDDAGDEQIGEQHRHPGQSRSEEHTSELQSLR